MLIILEKDVKSFNNIFNFFTIKNNSYYIELVIESIIKNLNIFFENKDIEKILNFNKNINYFLIFNSPYSKLLKINLENYIKENILKYKKFSNDFIKFLFKYCNNPTNYDLFTPNTFAYLINFLNDKQDFTNNLNEQILKIFFNNFYEKNSILSIKYLKLNELITFIKTIKSNFLKNLVLI